MAVDKPELNIDSEQKTQTPLAGFWIRGVAFILDYLLLNMLFIGLIHFLREPLYQISEYSLYLAATIFFCYFWFFNGPVGKGVTAGKYIFNMRTVNSEARPLSWGQSFVRTMIQCLYFVIYLVVDLIQSGSLDALTQIISLRLLFYSMVFTFINGALVGLNPFKQGFHDIAAGSIVTRGKNPPPLHEIKKVFSTADVASKKSSIENARNLTIIALVGFFVLIAFDSYQTYSNAKMRARVSFLNDLGKRFPVEGFQLKECAINTGKSEEDKETYLEDNRLTGSYDDSTTTTLTRDANSASLLILYLSRSDMESEVFMKQGDVEDIKENLGSWVKEKVTGEYSLLLPDDVNLDKCHLYFQEELNLFITFDRRMEADFSVSIRNVND